MSDPLENLDYTDLDTAISTTITNAVTAAPPAVALAIGLVEDLTGFFVAALTPQHARNLSREHGDKRDEYLWSPSEWGWEHDEPGAPGRVTVAIWALADEVRERVRDAGGGADGVGVDGHRDEDRHENGRETGRENGRENGHENGHENGRNDGPDEDSHEDPDLDAIEDTAIAALGKAYEDRIVACLADLRARGQLRTAGGDELWVWLHYADASDEDIDDRTFGQLNHRALVKPFAERWVGGMAEVLDRRVAAMLADE